VKPRLKRHKSTPEEDRARTNRSKAAEEKSKKLFGSPPKMKRRLPDKVGKVVPIYNLEGSLLMVGTEAEWRSWAKTRR